LVALVYHRTHKTATAGDLEAGGHYTSLLCHIGSKNILSYDDAANGAIIKQASTKAAAEFRMQRSQRKAPIAAVYYLMGGEATQEALYMQNLHYISNLHGIKIDPQGHGSWPSIQNLPPQCHSLAPISNHIIEQHHPEWLSSHHLPIVFTQEYQKPRPTKRFKGGTIKPVPQILQYLEKDPTENIVFDIAQLNPTMVHSPNIDVPQESVDHCLLSRLREPLCKWELHHIKHQSLWGNPFRLEEEEWDRKHQEQIAARRQRFREPSPAGTFRRLDEQESSNIAGTSPSYTLMFQIDYLITTLLLGLDISQLIISPKRKRKQGRAKNLIPFKALMTYYTHKSPGDPWTLVESPHPVNVAVANWEPGAKHTGWLGEGSLQRGIYVSIHILLLD
jgi:hypothetical protein